MVIDAIDHLAYSSENFFSRASIWLKFLFVGTVIAGVTLTNDPFFLGLWYCSILAVLASTNLPFFRLIELTLYSLVFVIVFGFGLSWSAPIFIASIFKVLATSTSLVLLAASTPYPAIFKSLGRIISQELAAILMLTYRSLFLLFRVFEDTLAIMRLRGAFSTRKPLVSLVNITSALCAEFSVSIIIRNS